MMRPAHCHPQLFSLLMPFFGIKILLISIFIFYKTHLYRHYILAKKGRQKPSISH